LILQLARAAFLGDAVISEALRLCEIIDVVVTGPKFRPRRFME